MDDQALVELYWARSEQALPQTAQKYGGYCHYIAQTIVRCHEDAEECVNDTWLRAWNAMPPHRPERLSTFLGKITRNLSLQRVMARNAQKRGGGEVALALQELEACIPGGNSPEQVVEAQDLSRMISDFLADLPKESRVVFVARYWNLYSVVEVAKRYGMSQSKVKSILFRVRNRLRQQLEKEGVWV